MFANPHASRSRRPLLAPLFLALLASCGDDDRAAEASTKPKDGPLYAVSTSVLFDDGATSYVVVVDALGQPTRVGLESALEVAGGARAYGPAGANVVYVTSSEAGTLTEVKFDAQGAPTVGRVLSLANLGISSTTGGNVHHFASPTKAYFVSQDTLEIVVWNPTTMEIVSTIPLALAEHLVAADGYFYFYPRPLLVNDKLVLVANQADASDIDGPVVISVFDTSTDALVSTQVEPRCHALLQSATDAQGDRYFASSDYSAALHRFSPEKQPPSCTLRMLAGTTSFDPTWSRSLNTELGSSLWTGFTPATHGTMYVQAIAEDAPGVAAATEPYDVTVAKPWHWYALSDGDAAPRAITADHLASPPLFPAIEVDDHAFVSLWNEVDTQLVDLAAGEVPAPGLTVPGFVYNIVRIR